MSTSNKYPPAENAVQARFAALFRSFSQSPRTRISHEEVAFLLERLHPRRGARLICCDRSIFTYGWGLTSEGCSVGVIGNANDNDRFDGAIWSLDELGTPPDKAQFLWLAGVLVPGGRLVIDAGDTVLPEGWRYYPSVEGLIPLGVARSSDNRRLYTWLRED